MSEVMLSGQKNSFGSDSDFYPSSSPVESPFRRPADTTDYCIPQDSGQQCFKFENKSSLTNDLSFLAMMPEYCDVTFLVGECQQPMCGVKAILATRSRVFKKMFFGDKTDNVPKKSSLRKTNKVRKAAKAEGKENTYAVPEFEPTVFKGLLQYAHCGSVVLEARTLLGLTNAADHYGMDDLKTACCGFLDKCLSNDTVVSLLSSAEKYIQYKATRKLVQRIFEYIDINAEEILGQKNFLVLPQHVVRLVLARDELQASETTKFVAAYQWVVNHCQTNPKLTYVEGFEPFVDVIEFHNIPVAELMRLVKPSQCVSDTTVLNALAFQADPKAVDTSKYRVKQRRGGKQRSATFSTSSRELFGSSGSIARSTSTQSSGVNADQLRHSNIRTSDFDPEDFPEQEVFSTDNGGNDDSKDDASHTSDEQLTSPSDVGSIRSGSSESLGSFNRTDQSNLSIRSAPQLNAKGPIVYTEL